MIKAVLGLIERLMERVIELGKLTPLAIVTALLPMAGTAALVFVGYPLGVWLKENPEAGAIGYTIGVAVFCGLALVPTNVIGIIGGFAFGFALGLGLLMAAIVAASFISYLIHRRIAGSKLPDVAERSPKTKAVYEALTGQGFLKTTLIIFLIRLSVAFPFALTNFILASARVQRSSYLAGTFLGMLPRSGAVVLTGAGLSELSLDASQNFWMIIFGILATLLSVIIITAISRRALDRLTQPEIA